MLKVFQLRAARSTLGLGVRDIGAYIDLSRSAISKIEREGLTSALKIKEDQNIILIKIFNDKGVFFPDNNSVCYGLNSKSYNSYLTRFQLRGGRAILGLSQREMSEIVNIEKNILNYLENLTNASPLYNGEKVQESVNVTLRDFFYENNISFPTESTIKIKS